MKKQLLNLAITGVLGTVSLSANAALVAGSVLDFTGTFEWSTYGTIPIQSGPDGGIQIGVTQDTNGHLSHGSPFNPPHVAGGLDMEWIMLSNAGMHFTASPIVVVDNDVNNDGGFTKTLDFSGWRMTWNGIPSINLGGGYQDCGTSTDGICVDTNPYVGDVGGTYDNGSGLATITCSTASCSISSTFTLTYSAVVPQADPSNFGGVPYFLNLTGHVSAVPLPTAAWLLGSGMLGLMSVAKRRRSR